MEKNIDALSDRLDSEIIRLQGQFLKEMQKIDGKVQTARKEVAEATQMMTTELSALKNSISGVRSNITVRIEENNKTSKMALGEIAYLKNCFDEVLVNVNSTVDIMIERFEPLMDFAESMNKK